MFAGEPRSSSDPTKRRVGNPLYLDAFRPLLRQIGGANIAGADRAWQPPTSSHSWPLGLVLASLAQFC